MIRKNLKDIILFAAIALLIWQQFTKKAPITVVQPIHEIETRVENKEVEIKTIETRVEIERAQVQELNFQLIDLKDELERVKSVRDTVQIIHVQDTVIKVLTIENTTLNSVVEGQDSIIVAQRYIIESKDTIIMVQKSDLKKVKRQRNWSIAVNIIQTAILVFKK